MFRFVLYPVPVPVPILLHLEVDLIHVLAFATRHRRVLGVYNPIGSYLIHEISPIEYFLSDRTTVRSGCRSGLDHPCFLVQNSSFDATLQLNMTRVWFIGGSSTGLMELQR